MEMFNLNKLIDDMGVYDVSLDMVDIPDLTIYTDIILTEQDLNLNDFTSDNFHEISVSEHDPDCR